MEKFKNKYRISSARAPFWDYGWNAAYFVTICTKNRVHFFGDIVDGKMNLSEIGKLANKYWYEIPQHFPFVELGAFVVMPNHIHGIIIIDKPNDGGDHASVQTQNFASLPSSQSPPPPSQKPKNQFGPQSKNLASIIRGYKIGVTKNAKKIDPFWQWQSRFHDHIIRDGKSYQNISNYIINNPQNWTGHKFNNTINK